MISLNDGLRIKQIDERCVAVQKKQIRKKDNEECWTNISYHGDIVSALKSVRNKKLIRFISDNAITLTEIIEKLEEFDKQFIDELKKEINKKEVDA